MGSELIMEKDNIYLYPLNHVNSITQYTFDCPHCNNSPIVFLNEEDTGPIKCNICGYNCGNIGTHIFKNE